MTQRYAYLDVLKAIAVIAVVLYHAGFLKYGYLGVDVFLVIAGYLTSRSLTEKKRGYFQFVFGRLMRLLPVLLVAGLAAMALGWFAMLPDDYENLAESVVATNLFGNNFLSAITTGDYWNIANEYKPLMHTWYVGLLMQCYLVYPLLFYLARLDKADPQKTSLIIISSLAFLSLLWYFGSTNEANRFYYLPARFFEFGVGGIIALAYGPSQKQVFHPVFSYVCYALLLALLVVGFDLIPAIVRLPMVVALCAVLLLSGGALENPVTANRWLSKIGIASYSIYVWHQVLLAFYRYIFGASFTVWTFLLYVAAVGVISWASYRLIEKGMAKAWLATLVMWVLLTGFAGYIYWNSGVVRDVPELGISVQDRHRRMNVEYTERGYQYDRPFASADKAHWLVIGNSFGRDFVNTILESPVADRVEVSFADDYLKPSRDGRYASADRVFIAARGISGGYVSAIEVQCWALGLSPEKIVVVGDKSFGEHNGHVYARRHRPDYYEQRVSPLGGAQFLERNSQFREFYGERFLDLMGMVTDDEGLVQVFTPEHRFISADGKHLTQAGAQFFAERIDWNKYLQ
jgi:peptidoglycan/LPS O-acetylase OafA/YrhL